MASATNSQLPLIGTTHPGTVLLDYLEEKDWSQRELARRSGITPKTISEICNGKAPVSASTALSLERVLSRPAHLWLNLQRQYDEAVARHQDSEELTMWEGWAKNFPLAEMRKFGWLASKDSPNNEIDELLSFFSVSSPKSWESVWRSTQVAYRQTRSFTVSSEAISAWLRATEIEGERLPVQDFDRKLVERSIGQLRKLTRHRVDEAIEPAQELMAAAGVAVVWVPELSRTGISGCARWLTESKALIAVTLRYKTDDQMWFTIFHELGHLLLHSRKREIVLDNAETDLSDEVVDPEMRKIEEEANRFSADTLVPPDEFSKFVRTKTFTNESIHSFAEAIGIAPGIVVGRLQHDKYLQPHQGNRLKQRLSWNISSD